MAAKARREYLILLDAAKAAAETAVDSFNKVWHPYRNETTLLLLTNAWELLAKAVLVHAKVSIVRNQRGETISAEVAVSKLKDRGNLDSNQAATVQQIISLRHAACHNVLPAVPVEVMHHLLFYGCKFFRAIVAKVFPTHLKTMSAHYVSLSFADMTTYADKVQRAVASVRSSNGDRKLIWLLERGVRFDGSEYITEPQMAQKYTGKKKVLPHLSLSNYLKQTDMVRVVPIEAPRNFTADIKLRKGSSADSSLPILIQKTDLEVDYPFLTKEVAAAISRSVNWTAKAITKLRIKDNTKYHQAVRASTSSTIHRYSPAAVALLQKTLSENLSFDPYKAV